jgi:asparagine synthetase B (glutamine-hydrolysing)
VGADEQCAGYGRHGTTFQRGGYDELKDELQIEVRRIRTRNLGRDDRCLSDCGKEAQFPCLDEDVVAYLEALPLQLKCDMSLPQGEGDKLILRKVARKIGVLECSTLVK